MPKIRVNVEVDEFLHRQMKAKADSKGLLIGDVYEQAISSWQKHESLPVSTSVPGLEIATKHVGIVRWIVDFIESPSRNPESDYLKQLIKTLAQRWIDDEERGEKII